ncbi:MAG TPA: RluA family pseudouridine synthase [Patescibacteria group bacterium]|nr:RluA family pseudouridine synthase [Patescibacteria group bacterium]
MHDLDILYEDSYILVLNKPSGVVVNKSDTSSDITIQDKIAGYIVADDEESEFFQRGGIVHRIDKDTSGVLLIAKDIGSFKRLQKQFKRREVTKEYVAVVHGEIKDDMFEVNAPIKRNPRNRLKYAIVEGGKEAVTRFEKLKTINNLTVLKCFPKTGRTHQIRIHLTALGHPIIMDTLYSNVLQLSEAKEKFPRMLLHATKITIKHPQSGEMVTFEAPLPAEFIL